MKTIIKLSLVLTVITFIYSCKEGDSGDNGDAREIFEGQWNVSETSKLLGARNYIVQIDLSKNHISRINLFDFYKLGVTDSVFGIVSSVSVNTITIPEQELKDNFIQGKGILANDNLINFTYYIDDGNDVDTVKALYSR